MSVPPTPLVTDLYQLTMMQGYANSGISNYEACFDLFFRTPPFNGGYVVYAGLSEALEFLQEFRFLSDDIAYLKTLNLFDDEFLNGLKDLRFEGDVYSAPEGSLVFPNEPILRVTASISQAQLVETALLTVINFQSLIATKSARVCQEAGEDNVIEFGLRRAQGVDGGLTAARAAYIGGCASTSNVYAGKIYGIPVKGTHAHAWVTSFENELTAFRKYVETYPNNSILLVDTYDTLKNGVPNAIKVGLEMKERGERLMGIRLDSGDLAFLSIEARKMLDEAGLTQTKIVGSSDLDEYIIHDLNIQGAKIDIYGVGTRLVTAKDDPALSGVYKMSAIRKPNAAWQNKLKLSEHKATLPGLKQVWRLRDEHGGMMADLIELEDDTPDFTKGVWGYHPILEGEKKFYDEVDRANPLLAPVMKGGKINVKLPVLSAIRSRVKKELNTLHPTYRRLLNPHVYKVSVGPKLREMKMILSEKVVK